MLLSCIYNTRLSCSSSVTFSWTALHLLACSTFLDPSLPPITSGSCDIKWPRKDAKFYFTIHASVGGLQLAVHFTCGSCARPLYTNHFAITAAGFCPVWPARLPLGNPGARSHRVTFILNKRAFADKLAPFRPFFYLLIISL